LLLQKFNFHILEICCSGDIDIDQRFTFSLEKDGKRFAENLLEEVIKSQRHVTKGNKRKQHIQMPHKQHRLNKRLIGQHTKLTPNRNGRHDYSEPRTHLP